MGTEFLATNHGIPALLASICVILAMNLLVKLGEFLWGLVAKRNEISQQSIDKLTAAVQINTQAVQELGIKLKEIEKDIAQIPAFKEDLRRLFIAVRFLAGDRWDEVKSSMEDIP